MRELTVSSPTPTLETALRLIVVTEARLAAPRNLLDVVGACLAAGARAVQLRNKGDNAQDLMAVGTRLREMTLEDGALLFVNDRLDVALALGADGVHVGPDDLPVAAVRACVPPDFLIGRSTNDPEVAREAVADGADYIGCGTVYATSTKADAGSVIGVEGVRRVVEAVDIPVIGIGGITVERASAVREVGAAGVAVVSAVVSAEDPAGAVREILAEADGR